MCGLLCLSLYLLFCDERLSNLERVTHQCTGLQCPLPLLPHHSHSEASAGGAGACGEHTARHQARRILQELTLGCPCTNTKYKSCLKALGKYRASKDVVE